MDEFSFKYIPEAELSKIVKEVQRDRRKRNEEKKWKEFLEEKRIKYSNKNYIKHKGLINLESVVEGSTENAFHQTSGVKIFSKKDDFNSESQTAQPCNGIIDCNDDVDGINNDCKNNSLSLDLTNANKLDKLRIFDCPNLLGFSSSNIHCHPQVNQNCHQYPIVKDGNHHIICQQIDDHFHCHNHRLLSSGVLNNDTCNHFCKLDVANVRSKKSESIISNKHCWKESSCSSYNTDICHPIAKTDNCKNPSNNKQIKDNAMNSSVDDLMNNISYSNKSSSCIELDQSGLTEELKMYGLNKSDLLKSYCHQNTPANSCIISSLSINKQNGNGNLHHHFIPDKDNDVLIVSDEDENLIVDDFIDNSYQNNSVVKSCGKMFKPLDRIDEEDSNVINVADDESNKTNQLKNVQSANNKNVINSSSTPNVSQDQNGVSRVNNQFYKNQVVLDGEMKLRIEKLKAKLTVSLNKILNTSTEIAIERDYGEDDLERKLMKTKDFVSRFSRNYLYQLRRQVEMLRKLNLNTSSSQVFYQKLFLSYQTALQAIQTCQNFLPNSSKLSSDKIIEFLELFVSFLQLTESYFGESSSNNEIKSLCSSLISVLKKNIENEEIISTKNKSISFGDNRGKNKIPSKRKSPKLSMYYSSSYRNFPINWKKTSSHLAKKRFGTPPSKKLPNNNLTDQSDDMASALNGLKEVNDNDYLELPKDCEERTKIFLLFDKLSEMIIQSFKEKEDEKIKNKSNVVEEDATTVGNKMAITKDEMKKVIQQIQEMYLHPESMGITRNVLDEKCPLVIRNKTDGQVDRIDSVSDTKNGKVKNTGDSYNKVKNNKKVNNPKNVCLTNIKFKEREYDCRIKAKNFVEPINDKKMGEGKFPSIELKMCDEKFQSILLYRKNFMNHIKMSPFYEEFNYRWSIVKRIGDKVLSNVFKDISKEIEINILIQKMYELELTDSQT